MLEKLKALFNTSEKVEETTPVIEETPSYAILPMHDCGHRHAASAKNALTGKTQCLSCYNRSR